MCQFCMQHGEGKKWYLEAKNYSQDLLSDQRRRKFIEGFGSTDRLKDVPEKLEQLARAPWFIRKIASARITRQAKKMHFGQVLPIEDVETLLGFTNSIVRVACVCRWATKGVDARYCYGVSVGPGSGMAGLGGDDSFLKGPDGWRMEKVTREEALDQMRGHEREGLCHTVWTFMTPFIGGICNCDRTDCLAMRATVGHGVRVMFRGEQVAETNPDLCIGCRACMRVCPFGAMGYSAAREKVEIDPRRCYGCGSCRSVCAKAAISLVGRREVAAAKDLW